MGFEDDIAEIKKEIVESHNLVIKTDNLIKNLSSEIRQIEKKQERYERKYIFNSVAAYVIFVVTIFGGMYVAFDAKVGVVRRENEELQKQLSKTKAETEEIQNKLALRSQQEKITERSCACGRRGAIARRSRSSMASTPTCSRRRSPAWSARRATS
jgi:flagellar biosynthesis chaperone FliJ